MSSRLRKAYVAAKFYELAHRWARARHSEAAAASSSELIPRVRYGCKADERELIPTVLPERLEYCSLHEGATSSIEDRCRGNLTK
jgi:hypothetical protein